MRQSSLIKGLIALRWRTRGQEVSLKGCFPPYKIFASCDVRQIELNQATGSTDVEPSRCILFKRLGVACQTGRLFENDEYLGTHQYDATPFNFDSRPCREKTDISAYIGLQLRIPKFIYMRLSAL